MIYIRNLEHNSFIGDLFENRSCLNKDRMINYGRNSDLNSLFKELYSDKLYEIFKSNTNPFLKLIPKK